VSASPAGYSTADLASLLDLTPARVRGLVRAGFLQPARGPRREHRFSFQDVVLLRTAKGLLDGGISPRKVRQALERLRGQLPQGRPLAALRITAEAGEVVVRSGREAWEPSTGQQVLDFEVAQLAARAAPLARRSARAARAREAKLDAEDWFALGLDLEAAEPDEARDAYRRTLELDPHHADAHLNLGRILHELGQVRAAEQHYRKALALRPDNPTALFNLGVALEDGGRLEEALAVYQRAVAADPALADAYYNLAGVHEKLGQKAAALSQLKTYRKLLADRS
jgi:tetratricopeptide (TPR) repeat protein